MTNSKITKLRLSHFRNYVSFSTSFESQIIVLTGENGAGKTNLLEALSFLSPGRGLRGVKLSQVTTQSSPPLDQVWGLSAELTLEEKSQPIVLGTGLELTPSGRDKRRVKINGVPAKSQSALTDWLSVIWVTPAMNRIFLETGSLKRKFIDRLIYAFDPKHAERLHRYEHLLKERSTVLTSGREDPLWLSQIEAKLVEEGIAIVATRIQGLQLIEEVQLTAPHLFISGSSQKFPRFKISMQGLVEEWLETMPALEVEEKMRLYLKEKRRQDAETGSCSIGPQKSILVVEHDSKKQRAEFCSTGEQKMLLLAIIFAFARLLFEASSPFLKEKPLILLLDDVVAHLDSNHRVLLFEQIETLQLQAWLTGTDSSLFQEFKGKAQFFTVHNATAICEQ